MPPNRRNAVADVVNLDSDDDEDAGRGVFRSLASLMEENRKAPSTIADANVADRETLEFRSFWKAGENFVIPKAVTPTAPSLLEHARIHPKFLHSNATSHKWAFGAIAELLDNAVDEIQNGATFVKIDKINIVKDNSPALVFQDDGGGMDPDGIRKCMSLGYSSKKSNTTIGQYGNGFKTSTMRLGADAIVFSRSTRSGKSTQSVGLLSYTFLGRTGQDDVIVPMIDIDISTEKPQPIIYGSPEDWATNLETLLKWSPFSTEDELLQQFEDIGTHGTKVIIYNLWLNDEGIYELSFDDDDEDIRLRDESVHDGKRLNYKVLEQRSHISYQLRYSLRAYASMLYLKKFKNFKIILCGVPVKQFNIADELIYPEIIKYKPHTATAEQATTEIKVGYIKEAPKLAICGYNVYHKNRLIRRTLSQGLVESDREVDGENDFTEDPTNGGVNIQPVEGIAPETSGITSLGTGTNVISLTEQVPTAAEAALVPADDPIQPLTHAEKVAFLKRIGSGKKAKVQLRKEKSKPSLPPSVAQEKKTQAGKLKILQKQEVIDESQQDRKRAKK